MCVFVLCPVCVCDFVRIEVQAFISRCVQIIDVLCVRGDVCVRMCEWGCVRGDVCVGMCAWGCVHGDVCVGMCACGCVRGDVCVGCVTFTQMSRCGKSSVFLCCVQSPHVHV